MVLYKKGEGNGVSNHDWRTSPFRTISALQKAENSITILPKER
jgi:hypothetical protein